MLGQVGVVDVSSYTASLERNFDLQVYMYTYMPVVIMCMLEFCLVMDSLNLLVLINVRFLLAMPLCGLATPSWFYVKSINQF